MMQYVRSFTERNGTDNSADNLLYHFITPPVRIILAERDGQIKEKPARREYDATLPEHETDSI
jgi:hypothetical protein